MNNNINNLLINNIDYIDVQFWVWHLIFIRVTRLTIKIQTMKNLILSVSLAMGTFALFPQNLDKQPKTATKVTAPIQDGFIQIATNKVPTTICRTLAMEMPNVTISKVYLNDKNQYKLEVAQEDGTISALYTDAQGHWIDM